MQYSSLCRDRKKNKYKSKEGNLIHSTTFAILTNLLTHVFQLPVDAPIVCSFSYVVQGTKAAPLEIDPSMMTSFSPGDDDVKRSPDGETQHESQASSNQIPRFLPSFYYKFAHFPSIIVQKMKKLKTY